MRWSDASIKSEAPITPTTVHAAIGPMPTVGSISRSQCRDQPIKRLPIRCVGFDLWCKWIAIFTPTLIVHRTPTTCLMAFAAAFDGTDQDRIGHIGSPSTRFGRAEDVDASLGPSILLQVGGRA